MKQRNKRQLLAAMAAMAILVPMGGVSHALEPTNILPTESERDDLAEKGKDLYFYGVSGGNVYLDNNMKDVIGQVDTSLSYDSNSLLEDINGLNPDDPKYKAAVAKWMAMSTIRDMVPEVPGIIKQINNQTVTSGEEKVSGDITLNLKGYEGKDWTRYYGAIGGDTAFNMGITGTIQASAKLPNVDGVEDGVTLVDINQTSTEPVNAVIERNGSVTNYVGSEPGSVSVIGGVGGSAAMAIGNLTADMEKPDGADKTVSVSGINAQIHANIQDVKLQGEAATTINGDVKTIVDEDANVVGWMNGGLAATVGGKATSTVTGNTVISIDGTERRTDIQPEDDNKRVTHVLDMMKDSGVNAIGVTGGGAAVTTNGGTATSKVGGAVGGGTTSITINNATVIGAVGGGVAASVDATGVLEQIYKPNGEEQQLGKNDSKADINGEQIDAILAEKGVFDGILGTLLNNELVPDDMTITATEAINGGTATSKVENDTNISITGTSTAAGVLGGGAAVASHTYTIRNENVGGKIPEGYSVNDEYGTSVAKAETGKSHITIALDKQLAEWGADKDHKDPTVTGKDEMLGAVKEFAGQLTNPSSPITPEVLKDFSNKGAAIGVFGGGAAIAQSGNRQHLSNDENGNADQPLSETDGAFATAATDGSDINLLDGYIVGVMGGGVAGAINNSTANAEMTDTVNITIGGNYSVTDENGKPATKEGSPEVVGLFGNGLAYFTGSTEVTEPKVFANLKGTATASATDTNINVLGGSVDGIIGGGMAIDDSDAARTNAIAETSGKVTINVVDGTINKAEALSGLADMGLGDLGTYAGGVNDAAGNAAIAAGGIALGGGAKAYVNEAEVNIAGGTVDGDIYGGGIAAYGYANNVDGESRTDGSHVGTSIINLHGSVKEDGSNTTTITGNVYAGGAVSANELTGKNGYTNASATVDNATVNLAGAQVNGILYGTGTVDQKVAASTEGQTAKATVGTSTLNLLGKNTLSNQITVGTGDEATTQTASKIQDFKKVVATAGSETILDEDYDSNTALISGGKMTAESGAYLNIDAQAQKSTGNESYLVATNMAEGSQLWKDDAFTYDRMGDVYAEDVVSEDGTNYSVVFDSVKGHEAEAAASMAGRLDADELQNSLKEAMGNWNNGNKVNQAARDYIYDWQMSSNPGLYKRGMMIGEDAAVTGNTVSIARDMADNVMQRLSFTDDYVQDNGWVNNDGGIWAKYIHRKYETDNMGSSFGGIHSSTDYDGAIVGVDFAKHGNFQSGVAFHYGSGDGNGLISRNDYDAWGFTLYGSLKDEEAGTNLMADIGYVTSDNDIDGTVENHRLSADRDVDAWTIGLRGEKEYVFGQNQLVPYVGLRYMSVNPARYSVSVDGKSTFGMDADNQNLWLLPIGVSFRNETVTDGGWRITPKLNLSYIWAFGDTDTDVDVNFVDGVSSGLYYDVMDDNSWLASLGVEATKDVWSFGVGYGYQKGDDTKNKTWFVNASYAF